MKDHRKSIREIAKDSGIEFSLHDLRRTFASIANNYITGMTQYTLKKLLNHENKNYISGFEVCIDFDNEYVRTKSNRAA